MKPLPTFAVCVLSLGTCLCLWLVRSGPHRASSGPSQPPGPRVGQALTVKSAAPRSATAPPASLSLPRSAPTRPPAGALTASLTRNPAVAQEASPKRAWDPKFLAGLRQAVEGDPIQFELAAGQTASGLIKHLERRDGQVLYVSGLLARPEAGRFFIQQQTLPGVAGDFVGVVECPASRRAWRIEPTGPGGVSELVERRLEEVMCVGLPCPAPGARQEEIPSLKPDDSPAYPIPAYQEGIAVLESLPGAPAVIYLDFQGGYTPTWAGVAYDRPDLSNAQIRDVWRRVAEDFMPFTINVTTDLGVYRNAAANCRQRVIVTPTTTPAPGAGGVAYEGSFNWTGDTPCWVFLTGSTKACADACSHEAGHTLNLSHMGSDANGVHLEYYAGQGEGETGWGPVMGMPYRSPVTQWSKGEYLFANNAQDQLAIVTSQNQVHYRPDDTGDTLATARPLEIYPDATAGAEGVIETTGDVDAFEFTTGGGAVCLRADPVSASPNLALQVALYDATDQLLVDSDPAATLGASITTNLPAGTFTFRVAGAGRNDPRTDGFSAYGSLGYYAITGTVAQARLPDRFTLGEHAPAGTRVGVVAANHPHLDALLYAIAAGNSNGAFAIDNRGILTVADNTLLDYESLACRSQFPVGFELFVDIVDKVEPARTETHRRVVVALTNVNESPVIDGFGTTNGVTKVSGGPVEFTTSIVEHTPPGTLACQVMGSDPDLHTVLSYAITAGNEGGMFRIDEGSGVIRVAGDPTAAVQRVYHLAVAVSDQTPPTPLTVTGAVTIRVELPYPRGRISYAVYTNISGTLVSDLTRAASFPSDPGFAGETALFALDNPVEGNGGAVMRGYLLPPAAGLYTFWIASQDNGELWLSPSTHPAAMNLIAYIRGEGGGTGPREWTKYPAQRSAPVLLPAGYAYYVEARMKAGTGTNHLAVAWECAGAGIGQQVVPGEYLASYFMNSAPHPVGFAVCLHRDAVAGSRLGTVAVTDFDRATPLTLAIVSGNDEGIFTLDPATGVLRLASEALLLASGQTRFTLEVRATDNGSPPLSGTAKATIDLVVTNAITTSGLRQEIWTDIGPGTAVADLLYQAKYPQRPDALRELADFDTGSRSYGSNYGSRIRAYLTPTNTGLYTLFIASDASGQLMFSSTTNPAAASRVAWVADGEETGDQEWTRYGSQQSGPLRLVAGQPCYLETLHKAAGGHDHVAVGWTGPGLSGTNPIAGHFLSPVDLGYAPVLGSITTRLPNMATNGTLAATLTGTDSALDTLAYKIVSGNRGNTFRLDPESGQITVADRTLLTAETVTNFQLEVLVQDSGYGGLYPLRSATATVTLAIADTTPPFVWSGNGRDANWSTAGNWASTVPGDNRKLVFSGTSHPTNHNDLLTSVGAVNLSRGGFRLEGNPLVLRGRLSSSGDNTWAINSVLNDSQTISNYSGTLVVAGSVRNEGQRLTLLANEVLRFDGILSGSGGITKTGSGRLVMSANNPYTGPTVIDDGTLALTNAGAISRSVTIDLSGQGISYVGIGGDPGTMMGKVLDVSGTTAIFTVPAGQTLTGQGNVLGDSVIEGTLAPRLSGLNGTAVLSNKTLVTTYSCCLTFRNNLVLAGHTVLSLANGSFPEFGVSVGWGPGVYTNELYLFGSTGFDRAPFGRIPWMGGISVLGELVCGGVLTVTTDPGFAPAYGDVFQLFDARRLTGSFASLSLPGLREGLEWDTRRLLVDGSIRVTHVPLQIAPIASPNGVLAIQFTTATGLEYVVESALSLAPPMDWTPQTTNAGTGKLMTLWLTATPAQPQRFFRVKAATPSSWVTDLVTTNVVPGQDIAVGFPETGDLP